MDLEKIKNAAQMLQGLGLGLDDVKDGLGWLVAKAWPDYTPEQQATLVNNGLRYARLLNQLDADIATAAAALDRPSDA